MQGGARHDSRGDGRPSQPVPHPESGRVPSLSQQPAVGDASAAAAATTLEHKLTPKEPQGGLETPSTAEEVACTQMGGHVTSHPAKSSARKAALAAAVRATRDSFKEAKDVGDEDAARVPPLAIAILVAGTRGAVQPFIALAMALQV